MGTINIPSSPPQTFTSVFFPNFIPFTCLCIVSLHLFYCHDFLSSLLPQAEQASLSHVVDLLSLILLTAIWAVCPRDSLALLGQWAQGKLTQVMHLSLFPLIMEMTSNSQQVSFVDFIFPRTLYIHHVYIFIFSQLMFSRPYSRKLEAEADKVGLQLAAKVL